MSSVKLKAVQFIKSVFILFYIGVGLLSCVKQEDAASLSLPECEIDAVTIEDCILKASSVYYYSQPFGGRTNSVTGTLNAANNSLTFNLPTGWYTGGVTVNFSSSDLTLANANRIRNGVNLFGITGSFVSTSNAPCAPTGLQGASCSASQGQFLFSQAFGGRETDCSNYDNGATNANCWVGTTGFVISTDGPTNPANCTVPGSQGVTCSASTNTYYYTVEAGGRMNDCVSGRNPSPCWVPVAGKFVTNTSTDCSDNTYNASTCSTKPSRFVYDTEFGGRNTTCTNDTAGSCYVVQSSKAALEPSLSADLIRIGVSIFGITGSYAGEGDWYSGMHRNQDTNPITMAAEVSVYAGSGINSTLPGGYRMVTSIIKDDEGFSSTEVTFVNRTGWGSLVCGVTQNTIAARIAHCESVFGSNATWDGTTKGNAGHSRWILVSRGGNISSGKGREVWIDDKTKLLWSSLVSKSINWCKAVGSSNNSSVIVRYREDDSEDYCDQDANQNNTIGNVYSACFEEAGFTSTDTDIDNAGKAGLTLASSGTSPAVAWRVPTFNDYEVADAHGIRFVMPDMGNNVIGEEWMATIVSSDKKMAWTYTGDSGMQSTKIRNQKAMVRCIGR